MSTDKKVRVKVDAGKKAGILGHEWKYVGYDECNYTHAPEGEALLRKFGDLPDAPYFMRTHHLFCTGNCHGEYKWGSTNAYVENGLGEPVYDWTVIDEIIDVYLRTNTKPFFELGFMPMDLADPKYASNGIGFHNMQAYKQVGWACPPKDYQKWFDLVMNLLIHCVRKYGENEVLTWYWELWNEPDIFYWRGTVQEYCKLFDYTEAAIHKVLPKARLGGPGTTGPFPGEKNALFLDEFLAHCSSGVNFVTGGKGTRLDYVTFHVKGGGFPFKVNAPKMTPSTKSLVRQVKLGLEITQKYGYGGLEVVLSEADPDGWAAGGIYDNANMNFRNTEYYASYVAASYHHIRNLATDMKMDVRPLAWAFMFVAERCFEGTRTFTTQGIDKAVFNLFKLYARMGTDRLALESSQEKNVLSYADNFGSEEEPELSGLATSMPGGGAQILLHSHHDDWDKKFGFAVELELVNLPRNKDLSLRHYRIDNEHSNAYAEWVRQGKPKYPVGAQYDAIKAKDGLELLESESKVRSSDGSLKLAFSMPSHGVSFIEIN